MMIVQKGNETNRKRHTTAKISASKKGKTSKEWEIECIAGEYVGSIQDSEVIYEGRGQTRRMPVTVSWR